MKDVYSAAEPTRASIELFRQTMEAAAARDGLPDNSRLRIIKAFDIPPIRRHVAHGLAALDEELERGTRLLATPPEAHGE